MISIRWRVSVVAGALLCAASLGARAQVASAADVQDLEGQIRLAEVRVRDAKAALALAEQRYKAGAETAGEYQARRSEVDQAQVGLESLMKQRDRALRYASLDRPVAVSLKDASIAQAASTLSKAAGVRIDAASSIAPSTRISLQATGVPLRAVLVAIANQTDLMIAPSAGGFELQPWPTLEVNGHRSEYRGTYPPWSDELVSIIGRASYYRSGFGGSVGDSGVSTRSFGAEAGSAAAPQSGTAESAGTSTFGHDGSAGAASGALQAPATAAAPANPLGNSRGQAREAPGGVTAPPARPYDGLAFGQQPGNYPAPGTRPGAEQLTPFEYQYQVPAYEPLGYSRLDVAVTALGPDRIVVAEPGTSARGEAGVWLTIYSLSGGRLERGASTFHAYRARTLYGQAPPWGGIDNFWAAPRPGGRGGRAPKPGQPAQPPQPGTAPNLLPSGPYEVLPQPGNPFGQPGNVRPPAVLPTPEGLPELPAAPPIEVKPTAAGPTGPEAPSEPAATPVPVDPTAPKAPAGPGSAPAPAQPCAPPAPAPAPAAGPAAGK